VGPRTYADLHNDAFTVDDDASVGVAHPVHLGSDVRA
jgi:hypothetical protein